jgi:hypothetical protein
MAPDLSVGDSRFFLRKIPKKYKGPLLRSYAPDTAQDDTSQKVAGLFERGCHGAGEFVPLAMGHLNCWSNVFDHGRAL